MTIFPRPSEWARSIAQHSPATPFAGGAQQYFAFLSYSHRDADTAKWLHDQLENFRVPMHLVGRITEHGAVPRRLAPIFRDVGELPASDDLSAEIRAAIRASRYLIVLCSPAAANSKWTNAEIQEFKRVRPDGCVLAAIVEGSPFASEVPGREEEECLPRALRYRYDRRGRPTTKRAEPLAADLRGAGEERRLGFLKLVAGMLGVGLDDLVRRDAVRRHRRMAVIAGASIAGMVVALALAIAALQARDSARDQRREAEGLVAFMLGDLKDKLEPIGRLDALDSVASKVLAYYAKQDTSELSDAALMQRSRALSLMASVANSRGDVASATRLYQEALDGTAEAIRRDPNDPQRLFDHAQNVFWTGEIAMKRGDVQRAEAAFREYKRLAQRMVALEPNNMMWRMETQYADANLGSVLFKQRRYAEASRQLEQALRTIEGLANADPDNSDYRKQLVEALAWVADGHTAEGRVDLATTERERHVALLERLLKESGDVEYGQKLVPAHRNLGNLYAWRGRIEPAIAQLEESTIHAEQLLAVERGNSRWLNFAAHARLSLADLLLDTGRASDAAAQARSGCASAHSLVARDSSVAQWRERLRDCFVTRVGLALAQGSEEEALSLGQRAMEAARQVKSSDAAADAYAVAKVHRLIGDAHRSLGRNEAARAEWAKALAALPRPPAEQPNEMSERQIILQRVGRTQEAQQLAKSLAAIGYRHPAYVAAINGKG